VTESGTISVVVNFLYDRSRPQIHSVETISVAIRLEAVCWHSVLFGQSNLYLSREPELNDSITQIPNLELPPFSDHGGRCWWVHTGSSIAHPVLPKGVRYRAMRQSAPEKDYVSTDLTLEVRFHDMRHCGSIVKWSREDALPMKFKGAAETREKRNNKRRERK
jgi:hypothetical protein